jgi:hypothetical protein
VTQGDRNSLRLRGVDTALVRRGDLVHLDQRETDGNVYQGRKSPNFAAPPDSSTTSPTTRRASLPRR